MAADGASLAVKQSYTAASLKGRRRRRWVPMITDAFHFCASCNALSAFDGDDCKMCRARPAILAAQLERVLPEQRGQRRR